MMREKKDFVLIYTGVLIALLMSKGLALVPALALDDYAALHQDRNPLFYLWQGRFTQALIQVVLTGLGVTPTAIAWPVIILFFAFAAWAIALGILYAANSRGSALGLSAVGAVIASHPYLTEYFTFRESLITQGASFALISLVFLISKQGLPLGQSAKYFRWVSLVLLMVFLAGAQQTAFIILGFFIFTGLVNRDLEGFSRENSIQYSGKYELLFLYFISAFLYAVTYLLIKGVADAPMDSRSSIISLSEIGNRLDLIASLTGKLLLGSEPILSFSVKLYSYCIFLFLLLAGISKIKSFLLITFVAILFYFCSIFLVSVSGVWWPVPRAVYALGFALGLSLLLAYVNAPKRLAKFFPVAVFFAALGMAFHSSALLYDQIRLNRWDGWVATGIAHDLAEFNVESESKVILVGAPWAHPLGLKTIDGDLNTSALAVSWAAKHLFMEVSGRKWDLKSVATAPECENVSPWPKKGAIRNEKDIIYVCLGDRK